VEKYEIWHLIETEKEIKKRINLGFVILFSLIISIDFTFEIGNKFLHSLFPTFFIANASLDANFEINHSNLKSTKNFPDLF
jgi:pheromone shutdown protein TraB